jgi:hypothetical protein
MARKTAAERYAARKIRVALDAADRQLREQLTRAQNARDAARFAEHIAPFEEEWAHIVETRNQTKAV